MSDKKQPDVKQPGWLCKVWLWVKRWWLPIAILLITSTGLACALSIPQQVFETPREPANDKSAPVLLAQSNLRLAFLYITGGAIAVVGLIETFRKNNNEKLKNNNEKLKNDQDKEKNDREHLRQVRADRRERYTKAVEQLGDEKAPIRMGGVYTLVGLVDEWLEDKNLSDDQRLKEGQVIINNLCAYIRSPFTLASHYNKLSNPTPKGIYKDKKEKFYADKAILDSEADVRLSIIKEIHDRIQGPDKNMPGAWSDFEYDFSGSTFFYPIDLTNSYYAKPINFSGSTYKGGADFCGSTYKSRAYFRGSTYENETDFSGSIFYQETYFGKDKYSNSSSCFTNRAPQFYDKTNHKNTLFGSHNNDFTVDIDKGYPINLNSEGLPIGCKFLTSEQKEYLEGKLQEIEKINDKILEVKDLKEKAELSEKLRDLNNELHKWREEATTVNVEDVAAEDTES